MSVNSLLCVGAMGVSMGVLCACAGPTGRAGPSPYGGPDAERARVGAVLDRFHAAAGRADLEAYFACLDPEAVFVGTDASERWTRAQFREFCGAYFARGQGWTYTPRERHVAFGWEASQRVALMSGADLYPVAFFEELLDNEKYGVCRGSGAVVGDGAGGWRIVRYTLSFTVPNEAAAEVVEVIGRRGTN